jgi:hypothetical protein
LRAPRFLGQEEMLGPQVDASASSRLHQKRLHIRWDAPVRPAAILWVGPTEHIGEIAIDHLGNRARATTNLNDGFGWFKHKRKIAHIAKKVKG